MQGLGLNSGEKPPKSGARREQLSFAAMKLEYRYWPGRGLLYSFLFHEIVFFGMLFVSISLSLGRLSNLAEAPRRDRLDLSDVVYLPPIGGGASADEADNGPEAPSAVSSPSVEGLSFEGPQPIISDPPDPTNIFQTLLQPELEAPQTIQQPLLLPNLVQMAVAERLPSAADQLGEALVQPILPTATPPPVAPPDLPLPQPIVEVVPEEPILPTLFEELEGVELEQRSLPDVEVSTLRQAEGRSDPAFGPSSVQNRGIRESLPDAPMDLDFPELDPRGTDSQTILALSPLPADLIGPVTAPAGEARGRFAVSPDPNPGTSTSDPGTEIATSPSEVGFGGTTVSSGTGAIVDLFALGGTGSDDTLDGSGNADGGSTTAAERGAGEGVGPGEEVFGGITIIGGGTATGAARRPVPIIVDPRPLQTEYEFSVLSTESSGGGLPYFGVFSTEEVHTVYLDMRSTVSDPVPSWTLEFGISRPIVPPPNLMESPGPEVERLELPFPAVKEHPPFPVELVSKYVGQMIIVYGVVNTEGALEQMSVKQSPDPLFDTAVLSTLARWVFEPAQVYGQTVAAKVLMGMPLSLTE